ncbi:MAG: RNA polymerase sporulation sigma factor SigK [Oscillospiraceae bacterium]
MDTALIVLAICNFMYFALHLTGVGAFPKPLSQKEEKICIDKIKSGDIEAKNMLIEHNLRLVAHIIKKYYCNSKEQDDLISIGTIGLIKAVSSFDYEKGTKFATYASRCIENEILMYFRSKKKSAQDVYISDPIDTDKEGHTLTLSDIMADDEDIIDNVDLKLNSDKLYEYMTSCLDKREREIMINRYGLAGHKPLTQREISNKMGISRSYVSRLESKAIARLREEFDKCGK